MESRSLSGFRLGVWANLSAINVYLLLFYFILFFIFLSRASDKRRNLAQQKAEAQRRLYGQGSMRKLTAGSSEWERQRHLLERRREELVRPVKQLESNILLGHV